MNNTNNNMNNNKKKISFEGARPEKGLKNFKTKIFIFEYFPNIPSEMNSTHPVYPILIPTLHM